MRKADERELLRRLEPGRRREAEGPRGGPGGGERDRLVALWAALEPPAAQPSPPGFTGRVMARVREAAPRPEGLVRRFGAVPARLAAGSALAAGLVAGAALGALVAAPARPAERGATVAAAPAAGEVEAGAGGGVPADVSLDSVAADVSRDEVSLDDEGLVAAAVAAAGAGSPAGEVAGAPAAAEPDLADGYLAALSALAEAS